MKATKQGAAYKSPSMRRMAEGGSAKPKRKVMKRAKDGTLTELKGANADKVRAAVKAGKTKDIQGGSKLAQMLGINKKYNVVGGVKPAKKPKAVSTSGDAPKRPKARTVARRGMSNTDQMRARTRGKTDTTTKTDANDPRNMDKSTPGTKKKTTAPAKNVRTKPNPAAQAKIDAYKKTKKDYPGGKDIGRGDPQKAKRKSTDAELARRTDKKASTRKNAIGAPYARQEQIARATKKADAARKSKSTAGLSDRVSDIVGGKGAARRKARTGR